MQVAADDCDEKTDINDVPMEENKVLLNLPLSLGEEL